MNARQRLVAYLQQTGLSTARAEANLDAYRDELLREAAAKQRSIAERLPAELSATGPLIDATANVIDPDVIGVALPARVRDAAADLINPGWRNP